MAAATCRMRRRRSEGVIQLFFGPNERPLSKPEDVIDFLGKGKAHWKIKHSACETAHSWFQANGLPASIQEILQSDSTFTGATLKKAYFEKQTELDDTSRRPSQTDVLAFIDINSGIGILGIEGKVEESFGPRIDEWNDSSPGKLRRLAKLLERLEFAPSTSIGSLRYQLFHRTVATLLEAERASARDAAMIVQSFSPKLTGFDDFQAFASALGTPIAEPCRLSMPIKLGGVRIRLGWTMNNFCAPT